LVTQLSSSLSKRLEPFLFFSFMAILVWAPLPFASNRIWGGALLAVLVGGVFCTWMVLFLLNGVQLSSEVWRRARLPLLILVLVQLWVFVQIQYLPRPLVELLSPQAYAWHIDEGWLSLSLDRQYSQYYLIRGCTYTAAFFLALTLVNTYQRVEFLLKVLVFSGTLQAAYGAFMVLSGMEFGFFVHKYTGLGVATGTFVNRNHLAGYLVMCLSAGIGLLLSQLATDSANSLKERVRRWLKLLLSPKMRLRIYLAIMVIALVLTRARMGNIAFFTSLGLAGALALYAGRQFSWRMVSFLGSLFVVDMVILGKWFGLDKLIERLVQTNPELAPRRWSNEYSVQYISDFPLTGSGGGSFYGIFPNYQGSDLQGFHQHAHNDYLEFAVELGIPAALLLAGFVVLAQWSAYKLQRSRQTRLYKGAGFAVTMTVIWAAIHSTTDFNLQIPANALTFVTILALSFICRGLPRRNGL
jgi:O-antigen ligase